MPIPEARVVFMPMNKVISVPYGTPLLSALRKTGILIESICGGKGLCRKCRVILTKGSCSELPGSDACRLSPDEVAKGYHFACQVMLTADAEFTIPVESRIDCPRILLSSDMHIDHPSPSVVHYPVDVTPALGLPFASYSLRLAGYTGPRPRISSSVEQALKEPAGPLVATVSLAENPPEILAVEPACTARPLYGVAIDLGTTTVVGCLVLLSTGEIASTGAALNRQITYGEELLTRIGYAHSPEGLATLRQAATSSISAVIDAMTADAGISAGDIVDLCIAGNTVMHHLFCGIDPEYLDMANASVSRRPVTGPSQSFGFELHPGAAVFCLPNVSRFVGGDAIGDIIACRMHASDEISLLVDMGTNGEIVLGNRDWLASVSCASGPAFEGAGISCGMRAQNGAIDHVRINPETKDLSLSVIGSGLPRGICGSGIIDAAACMTATGALDFAGKLSVRHPRVRQGSEGPEFVVVQKSGSATGSDLCITQKDIDYLMDSKAAACGAIGVLLKKYKLAPADIRHVYLAGAFGAYTDMTNAIRFGILPEFPNAEFHPIGNGSLSGAYAALVSRPHRQVAETIAQKMVYIDLMVDTGFFEEYSAALYIPGKREYFPSQFL